MVRDYFEVRDGESAVIGDARAFPIVLSTWFGPATESILRPYFAWNDAIAREAIANQQRFIVISDNTRADRPTPIVRRLTAELVDDGPAAGAGVVEAAFVVFESALVRGAVTAMQWISRQPWDLITAASVAEAIRRSLLLLDARGAPRPLGLSAELYRAPTMPGISAQIAG